MPAGTAQSPAQTSGLPTPPPVTDPTLVTVASATPTNQTATGPTPFQVPDAVPAPAVDARSDGLHHLAEAAAGSGVTGVTAAGDNMGVRDQGLQLEPAGAGDVVKVLEEPESHPILGEVPGAVCSAYRLPTGSGGNTPCMLRKRLQVQLFPP